MKRRAQAMLWFGGYLALLTTPLIVLLLGPVPAKGGFAWEAGIALGFAALAMMALQFVLTARLRRATAPFGIDVIYYFHRYLGYALLVLVIGHPLLLLSSGRAELSEWNPFFARWPLLSGMLALAFLLLLITTSAWRKRLNLSYNGWRRVHLLLAVGAAGLGFGHMWGIGYYSSSAPMAWLWVTIALSLLLIVLLVRGLRPWRLTLKPWTVREVRPELGESWTLTLEPRGHGGLSFRPGQFAWLSLGHSPFNMQEHPFSIACAPRADGVLQFTVKALGDFTRTVGRTPAGATAYVDGPYGIFSCHQFPHAPGYVFVAGGIGVAPVISMLQSLAEAGDRRRHVLFGAHSRWERIPRRDEIVALGRRLNLETVPVLEQPPQGWSGAGGWITRAIMEEHLPDDYRNYHYFVCGPEAMTQAVERFLHELGVSMKRVHTELFDMA